MSNSPWRTGLKPRAAEPKWTTPSREVSPRRQPTWAPPKPVEVAPAKHSTPAKYTPTTKGK